MGKLLENLAVWDLCKINSYSNAKFRIFPKSGLIGNNFGGVREEEEF